jgi:hypothetical protein
MKKTKEWFIVKTKIDSIILMMTMSRISTISKVFYTLFLEDNYDEVKI